LGVPSTTHSNFTVSSLFIGPIGSGTEIKTGNPLILIIKKIK